MRMYVLVVSLGSALARSLACPRPSRTKGMEKREKRKKKKALFNPSFTHPLFPFQPIFFTSVEYIPFFTFSSAEKHFLQNSPFSLILYIIFFYFI